MKSIAVIGMKGAGKTVFLTALAWKLRNADRRGRSLEPLTRETGMFMARNWEILQSQEWLPSTAESSRTSLAWRMQFAERKSAALRFFDFAGQDFEKIFADAYDESKVPGDLLDIADYCRHAHLILLLVNLGDFAGESDLTTIMARELVLKFALDHVGNRRSQEHGACLVFTQADLYQPLADAEGGWDNVARKYLPTLNGVHLSDGRVPVFAVAAVSETQLIIDNDGHPQRFPAASFEPQGLDTIIDWIEEMITPVESPELSEVASVPKQRLLLRTDSHARKNETDPGAQERSFITGGMEKATAWITEKTTHLKDLWFATADPQPQIIEPDGSPTASRRTDAERNQSARGNSGDAFYSKLGIPSPKRIFSWFCWATFGLFALDWLHEGCTRLWFEH
jgi:hypothetical protein